VGVSVGVVGTIEALDVWGSVTERPARGNAPHKSALTGKSNHGVTPQVFRFPFSTPQGQRSALVTDTRSS